MRLDVEALKAYLPANISPGIAALSAGGGGLALAAVVGLTLYFWPARDDAATETAVVSGPLFTPVALTPPAPAPATRPSRTGDAPASSSSRPLDDITLIRGVQRNLKRAGCYDGPVNGAWNSSTRQAMSEFTGLVNARLPVDRPDPVLLALLEAHTEVLCDLDCGDSNDCQAHPAKPVQREATLVHEARPAETAPAPVAPPAATASLPAASEAQPAFVPKVPAPAPEIKAEIKEASVAPAADSADAKTQDGSAALTDDTGQRPVSSERHRSHRHYRKNSFGRSVSTGFRKIQRSLNMIFR